MELGERFSLILMSALLICFRLPEGVIAIFVVQQGIVLPLRMAFSWLTSLSRTEVEAIADKVGYIFICIVVDVCIIVAALVLVLLCCACRIIPP